MTVRALITVPPARRPGEVIEIRTLIAHPMETGHRADGHGDHVEAARLMETHKISGLIVVDDELRPVGALNIHDLLRARVV